MRSILAEALLNRIASERFRAFSAGSSPLCRVDPQAVALLRTLGYDTKALRSKCWVEFLAPTAPVMDVIVLIGGTMLRTAWPGEPLVLEWHIPTELQPDHILSDQVAHIYGLLEARIAHLASQPLDLFKEASGEESISLVA
ncbi:hypothetical protein VZ95_15560 [Elstera litoralis]|uniref:Phosphotyrosine protein phosphatase I domain-containing protein n=2 Tax=Elstera litoralis TaxID=552518 RepID=A0A0F3IPX1_9PROT|nr:hypothetical protein VZ95_15560 [Elstera litoralis]